MTEPSLTARFMMAFAALREATGDSPERLAAMFQNTERLLDLSHELRTAWSMISSLSTRRKIFVQSAPEFIEAEKDYRDRWRPAVEYVCDWPILSLQLLNDLRLPAPTFEEFKAGKSWLRDREEPEPHFEDSFDPLRHDGGLAIRNMLWLVEGMIDGREAEDQRNTLTIGLEAVEHFEAATGISIAEAFGRWNRVPPIFVPKHVSDRHGLTDKGSLFGLLEDAIRAYVAGATGASVAMCRAVLERLLREHYLPTPPDERTSLTEIIEQAGQSGHFPKQMRDGAWQLKHLADAVLHRAGQATARDEEKLIAAFGHLKHWIESAPIRRPAQ